MFSRVRFFGAVLSLLPSMGCGGAEGSPSHAGTEPSDASPAPVGDERGDENAKSEPDATVLDAVADAPRDVIDEFDLPPPPDGPVLPCPEAPYSGVPCTPGQTCNFALGAPGLGESCTCGADASWVDCQTI